MKKFLCVCNGGNCRSAALAEVLKGCFGKEAIAVGTYWFPRESIEVFADWSDVILDRCGARDPLGLTSHAQWALS